MPPSSSPASTAALAPPPEGIYRSFEDLLTTVQRVAKDNGYGVVKLRASNYREGKPTRYDLVCDRGGVKYSSTAKKRNPTTRKVDCPFRAKAVCEVQLGNQWRFAVQDGRHNHEARVPAPPAGQETGPLTQNLRSLANKIDRLMHDMSQGFIQVNSRFDGLEKRMETMEQRAAMMGNMGGSLPAAMGSNLAPGMGNGPAVVENRLNNVEARMNAMESRVSGLDMPIDEVESRLLSSSVL